MIQFANISVHDHQPVLMDEQPNQLCAIVQEQFEALAAEGFIDFQIRWNGTALAIEARGTEMYLRREFNPAGGLELEKFVDQGIGVERRYAGGIDDISEKIFVIEDDR